MANKVKEWMQRTGLTSKDIEAACHVTQATVSRWVTNKSDPKDENVTILAKLFQCWPTDIIYYAPYETWNVKYPAGVALRTGSNSGLNLTDEDIAKIAAAITPKAYAVQSAEARIIAAGVDKLPPEDRARALNVMRAMFALDPELFRDNIK